MDPTPASRSRLPRLRLLAALLAAPVAIALALLLSAPLWIDASAVRARIAALVDASSGGRARWESLELDLLPRPRASLRQLSFALPPRVALEAREVSVELKLLPLLRGEVRPARIVLDSPTARVQLPPPDPAAPPPTVAGVRAALRGALDALFDHAPVADVDLRDGELVLLTAAGTTLRFTAITLRGRIADGTLAASASASSPLFDRLVVEAEIGRARLEGAGFAKLTGLHLGALAALLPSAATALEPADAAAALSWQSKGLEDLSASVHATAPALLARRGAGRLETAGLAIEAQVRLRGDAFELELPRVALARPRVEARGRLAFAPGNGWRAALDLARADPGQLQAAAAGFLPDVALLAKPPVRFAQGASATLALETAAPVLADLADIRALHAQAQLEAGTLQVTGADLTVRSVAAHATLLDGTLRVDSLVARTDAGELTQGALALKLDAKPVTLEGSATARLDVAGTAALARRLLDPSGSASRELQRLHDLQGRARVRVHVSGDAQRPRPSAELSDLHITGRHDLLPLPLAITAGTVTFAGQQLSLQGLSGSVGRSTLQDVAARLRLGTAARLESAVGSATIDLEEVLRVARARPALADQLSPLRASTGLLLVRLERAAGPLADPRALDFALSASPRKVVLDLPALGAPVGVDGGHVTLRPGDAVAADVGVTLLDGALRLGGRHPLERRGAAPSQVTARGTLGPQVLSWIQARAGLPEAARLRDALTLEDVVLYWPGGGDFATRGGVRIAGGPALSFDIRRTGGSLEARSLTVRDADSDCTLGGSLEGSRFAMHFTGHLAGRSLAGPLRRPDIADARVHGDLRANGDWTDPGRGKADGYLEARQVPIPAGKVQPLVIERARLDADGTRLAVREAVILAGPSRLALEGSIDRSARRFRLDATIRGESLELPAGQGTAPEATATPPGGAVASPGQAPASAWERLFAALEQVPIEGKVRVDLGRLRAGRLEIAPLQASAVLEDARLQVDIGKAALCAVALSGRLSARRGHVGATGTLSARGAPLETTLPCLTDGRLRFVGRLDLDGSFSAQGAPEALADSLQARFRAVSRDGRIDKFDELARLLRLVNLTEVARGAIAVRSAGMAYRSASITGTIKGRVMHLEEGILDAEGIKIVAEGTIDYRDGSLAVNVLAAPMQTANWLVDRIPLVRRIFGGTVLAIPARVGGTIRDPVVVPLGARAVGSRMVDLLANTVRLPADLVKTLDPVTGKAGNARQGTEMPSSSPENQRVLK